MSKTKTTHISMSGFIILQTHLPKVKNCHLGELDGLAARIQREIGCRVEETEGG
jgi:hypothetical protein